MQLFVSRFLVPRRSCHIHGVLVLGEGHSQLIFRLNSSVSNTSSLLVLIIQFRDMFSSEHGRRLTSSEQYVECAVFLSESFQTHLALQNAGWTITDQRETFAE